MAEQPIRTQAMSKREDVGQPTSESTALVEYRAPPVPAPVPTRFRTDLPALSAPMPELPPPADPDVEPTAVDTPAMPRAAALDELSTDDVPTIPATPSIVPEETASAPPTGGTAPLGAWTAPPGAGTAPHAATVSRPRRFVLLAACVALAAGIGAIAGSLGHGELQRHLLGAGPSLPVEAPDDIRVMRETVAQLRANVKTLADNVAAMRTSITASSSTVNGQLNKITEALDRTDHRSAAAAAPPETTGSIAAPAVGEPKSAAKPAIVEGWTIRKVYDGAALIEGRYGVVEVEPGMNLPGLGRVQDIRRQDGHWVVVTPKGLIMPVH
jgi:hypothetical protein